jgi:uncharacterized protein YjbJ (UPF0337 family)
MQWIGGNKVNEDIIQGKWRQIKGDIKARWGKLRDDDLDQLDGHREYLVGKIQERYGVARDEAEKEVREFEKSV